MIFSVSLLSFVTNAQPFKLCGCYDYIVFILLITFCGNLSKHLSNVFAETIFAQTNRGNLIFYDQQNHECDGAKPQS